MRSLILLAVLACATFLRSETAQVTPEATSEVISKEASVTFKSTSNLVPVPVVVRDSKGHAIGSLSRDDFQLFDNGKLQVISRFTIEKTEVHTSAAKAEQPAAPGAPATPESDGIPDRFTAYLFDDLHLSYSEMKYTRDAAIKQIDSAHTRDRIAIYTTSGRSMTDFTSDRAKLHAALDDMGAGQGLARTAMQSTVCPPVSYYQGDLIYNMNNANALAIALADAGACAGNLSLAMLTSMVNNSARDAVNLGDRETVWALDALRTVVAKMASMPGQRNIVLISPGFLVLSAQLPQETGLIERAIRANVVIGALDARGVYSAIPGGDASTKNANPATIAAKYTFETTARLAQSDIMDELSSGTGGTFFKGNNDMDGGLARVAATPEYLYVLAFTPQDLKLDGSYHKLKVVMTTQKGMSLQVRKGYYSAKYSADPKEQIKQQIEQAFFSRDEIHDLPAALSTQYFKLDNGDVKLSAVATIDIKKLTFHKVADRNLNDVTVETGIFDEDGNFVTGFEKVVTLKLLDDTLEKRLQSGIGVKSTFTVHPGRYVIRMVVRDTGDQLMAAQSSAVNLP
jgi:VWFA-related protein